ncbi:MAG: VWA domain-containing protein [Sandaracinaceae bacterium]
MRGRRAGWAGLVVALASSLPGCTDAGLQPSDPDEIETFDNRLDLRGEFCLQPDGELTFPVKVLFILDQSASLQCTDGNNVRFDALDRSMSQIRQNPDSSIGFVGFANWAREQTFTRDRDAHAPYLSAASGGGTATDYQGAIATAIRILEQDMLDTPGAERARTRYVVVFVSDGVPEPRCNAGCEDSISNCADGNDNDGDGRTDGSDPDCANVNDSSLAPDSLYGVCNTDQEVPDDIYVDYDGICPAYNQPEQILRRVDELIALADIYSAGSVTLNTVLLFSPQAVVEGRCPGASAAFGYDREQARATLRAMAQAGLGVFRDANLVDGDDEFLDFDYAALQTSQALRGLTVANLHALRSRDAGIGPDRDLDGLSDLEEEALGTDPRTRDSDGDGYGDLVEVRGRDRGLEPLVPSAAPCPDERDLDGDRLLNCEESLVDLDPRDPDTDGDEMLDWMELALEGDPLRSDAFDDPDFDGVSTLDETRGGTLPTIPDEPVYRAERFSYRIENVGTRMIRPWGGGGEEERSCFDYGIDGLRLVDTPNAIDRGLNRILVYASEAPAQLAGARSETRVACFEAIYQGPTLKVPPSGVIDASEEGWTRSLLSVQDAIDALAPCPFLRTDGAIPNRGQILSSLERCMPPESILGGFVYDSADRRTLLTSYVSGGGAVNVRQPAAELFVPIETFNPARDCFRPWEMDRLQEMLGQIATACTCLPADLGDGNEEWVSPCCPAM